MPTYDKFGRATDYLAIKVVLWISISEILCSSTPSLYSASTTSFALILGKLKFLTDYIQNKGTYFAIQLAYYEGVTLAIQLVRVAVGMELLHLVYQLIWVAEIKVLLK